jgi:hypothetical protein
LILVPSAVLAQEASRAAEPAAVAARPARKAGGRDLRMRDLLEALHEPIDAAAFQGADLTLKEFLQRLEDALARRGKGVPVVLDFEAFKEHDPDAFKEPADLEDVKVSLPPVPARLRVASALELVLAKLPTGNATLALKPGALVITTIGRTTMVRLLEQRVWVQFEHRPCVDALADLFELTGLPVIVDNRVLAQARRPVTATFANGAALGTVLPLVTEMAGLKLLVSGNSLYVTSPAHARLLEEEADGRLRESLLLAARENALTQQWWMNVLLAGQLSARPRR